METNSISAFFSSFFFFFALLPNLQTPPQADVRKWKSQLAHCKESTDWNHIEVHSSSGQAVKYISFV